MRGGHGSSGQGALGERVGRAAQPAPGHAPQVSPARHCFVAGAPSLLVEWRRTPAGWEGRVLSLRWLDGEGWATVERWLPATQITPA